MRRRKPKKGKPPVQSIPANIKKGDEVLYMLQRVSHHYCVLVGVVKTNNSRNYEKYMLDNFGLKIKMKNSLRYPCVGRMHVKFGISKNLPKRLEDINDDIFGSGSTEWRAVSWIEYIFSLCRFWWYRNRGKVLLGTILLLLALYLFILIN